MPTVAILGASADHSKFGNKAVARFSPKAMTSIPSTQRGRGRRAADLSLAGRDPGRRQARPDQRLSAAGCWPQDTARNCQAWLRRALAQSGQRKRRARRGRRETRAQRHSSLQHRRYRHVAARSSVAGKVGKTIKWGRHSCLPKRCEIKLRQTFLSAIVGQTFSSAANL